MTTLVNSPLTDAMRLVDEFFDGVFAPLSEWLPELTAQLGRHTQVDRLTGAQVAELARDGAFRVLDRGSRPLYGAGYCASELVVSEGNPLAWWQGPDRFPLAASTFGPGQTAIDLVRLEWYRIPQATGMPHIAGPFVDYLCSNEITLTSSMPVQLEGKFAGVVCADVLVASLEEALLPGIAQLAQATLVNASGRVVLSSSAEHETGERFPGTDRSLGVRSLHSSKRVLTSVKYPFSLIAVE